MIIVELGGKDITDLLISGKFYERKYFGNYNLSNYVYSEKINDIISNISKYDLFTVTSNLGNGKSIFENFGKCINSKGIQGLTPMCQKIYIQMLML